MFTVLSMIVLVSSTLNPGGAPPEKTRTMQFRASTEASARIWQKQARERLFALMMGGGRPDRVPLDPKVLRTDVNRAGGYAVEEITLQSLKDRKVHAWIASPTRRNRRLPAVLALHGHGGTGEQIVRGQSLYWYGRALAEMGYVVISPDIGQHELQHSDWTLMGERVWDALRCVDYLETRPDVDRKRIAVAGLSLGGETTMYVAALDERLRAVNSSGWLTTIGNMKRGHCPCWNFSGLQDHFDFADIFACIAPRPLVCELGQRERAPGGFPVEIGQSALAEIREAYRAFKSEHRLKLDAHPGGHVFVGREFWGPLREAIGVSDPWEANGGGQKSPSRGVDELSRRGEIARRCFARALGVFDGWWATRDHYTNLYPRRVDQPVWAPQDNAADMLPFLFLTAHFVAPDRIPEVMKTFRAEREITNREGVLPDWFDLKSRSWVHKEPDLKRLIFNAAEYCKDGILPMVEGMGDGPWIARMEEMLDAIFQRAPVKSDFGMLPADDTEVNGDLLQALARIYSRSGDEKYWQWGDRITRAYCREVLPGCGGIPAYRWDFTDHRPVQDHFSLNDHGNEIAGGLAEFYIVTAARHPAAAKEYLPALQGMFSRLLQKGRNPDGIWYGALKATTGEPINTAPPDTWGYALSAAAAFGMASGDSAMAEAAKRALININRPAYLDWTGADSFADSIEGALLLLNRYPEESGFRWLEQVLPIFLARQRDDGIVEGWYGDGNFARTALMAALYYTQGARALPWRDDVRIGGVRQGNSLLVGISADKDWAGRVLADSARHRLHFRLPLNYPRLNELPEWFTVEAKGLYEVTLGKGRPRRITGEEVLRGIVVDLKAGTGTTVRIRPIPANEAGMAEDH